MEQIPFAGGKKYIPELNSKHIYNDKPLDRKYWRSHSRTYTAVCEQRYLQLDHPWELFQIVLKTCLHSAPKKVGSKPSPRLQMSLEFRLLGFGSLEMIKIQICQWCISSMSLSLSPLEDDEVVSMADSTVTVDDIEGELLKIERIRDILVRRESELRYMWVFLTSSCNHVAMDAIC